MEKLTEVLAMGGYGPYVWPSFAIAAAMMLALLLTSLNAQKKANAILSHIKELPSDET